MEDPTKDMERSTLDAVTGGHTTIVNAYLNIGVDPNTHDTQGNSILFFATAYGHDELVKNLLERGATPNTRDQIMNTTPLMVARCSKIATLLIEHGAGIDERDINGLTALMHAAMKAYDSVEIVNVLLLAGADPEIKSYVGYGMDKFLNNEEIAKVSSPPIGKSIKCAR